MSNRENEHPMTNIDDINITIKRRVDENGASTYHLIVEQHTDADHKAYTDELLGILAAGQQTLLSTLKPVVTENPVDE